MSYAAKVLQGTLQRLLIVQALLILAAAAVYLATKGWPYALAALFGGGIALLNSLISAQRLRRAAEAVNDARRSMLELYLGAVTRFVATPALVAVGIVWLRLDPLAIIVGFAVAQLAYFMSSARSPAAKPN